MGYLFFSTCLPRSLFLSLFPSLSLFFSFCLTILIYYYFMFFRHISDVNAPFPTSLPPSLSHSLPCSLLPFLPFSLPFSLTPFLPLSLPFSFCLLLNLIYNISTFCLNCNLFPSIQNFPSFLIFVFN